MRIGDSPWVYAGFARDPDGPALAPTDGLVRRRGPGDRSCAGWSLWIHEIKIGRTDVRPSVSADRIGSCALTVTFSTTRDQETPEAAAAKVWLYIILEIYRNLLTLMGEDALYLAVSGSRATSLRGIPTSDAPERQVAGADRCGWGAGGRSYLRNPRGKRGKGGLNRRVDVGLPPGQNR